MTKVITDNQAAILAEANDLNFYGKRKRETRLAACDKILDALEISQHDLDSRDLCDWLLANKPVKETANKVTASNKPSADTMTGEMEKRLAAMPVNTEAQRFIVTTAQNNSCVAPVFSQLVELSEKLNAQLIVLPVRYNKNAFSAAVESEDEYFAKEVKPFLAESDQWLFERDAIRLAPSAAVLPTAKYPMNAGAQLNSGELVTVIAATKQQMQTLPRLPSQPIKEAWSTGCCTVYNYTESRAGAEAETEHVFGGLLISERNGGYDVTNIRQGDDGTLAVQIGDMCYGTDPLESPCVVLGDLHCEMQDKMAYAKTIGWLEMVRPARIAVHDILHFSTRSHHNRRSGKHLFKMELDGNTVKNDLTRVIEQVNELAALTDELYIVESNHNSALDIWLDDSTYSPQTDPRNAKLYYLLNYAICEAIEAGYDKPALEIAMLDIVKQSGLPELADNVVFGRMDEAQDWYGIDVSQHGHKGQNGSMGNPNLFAKWRIKLVTGHTHSPRITGDVLTVGVMAKLDQGYNRGGASSWNQANAIIHSNGVSQLMRVNPLVK